MAVLTPTTLCTGTVISPTRVLTAGHCVGNPETGFVCGATCVAQGGACTTTADCCSGLPCTIPEGSTTGVCGAPQGCADYGQACTMSSDCCNMLPCTDGKCQGIIL